MNNSNTLIIPIGRNKEKVEEKLHEGFRTIEQFETVRSIVIQKDFNFSCGPEGIFNPFQGCNKRSTYQGPFMFLWYDIQGNFHGVRIGKRGKILREYKNGIRLN